MRLMSGENPEKSQILLYQTDDWQTRLEVHLEGETVWLSLNQMAELFQRDKSVVSRHIRNIFDEGELERDRTVANFATVQMEGAREVNRDVEYFNLDVIISVGYRVKSHRGTQFRIWATQPLPKQKQNMDRYRQQQISQPSEAERDFEVVLEKIKKFQPGKKKSGGKAK